MMKNKGFTLLIAVVVTGTLLLVATGVIFLAVKQKLISSIGEESQHAFYAADSGLECAFFWDVKHSTGLSAFSTTTSSRIKCNYHPVRNPSIWLVGGSEESNFTITFFPDPYCAKVTVNKNSDMSTTIVSRGYNTCDTSSVRRTERAIRATY